jgi:signal transduction histidine kinase
MEQMTKRETSPGGGTGVAHEGPGKPPASVGSPADRPGNDAPRATTELLSEFAHDLSEGLGTIGLFVNALEHHLGDLDATVRRDLDGIRAGLGRMNELISGKLWTSSERRRGDGVVDANAVVRDARANVEARVADTGAVIVCDPLPWLRGDAADLTRLFQNLLANAIQHRHPDRVPRIRIGAHRQRCDWLFEVSDNGRGMAGGFAARAFDSTVSVPEPAGGRPLGLGICARIVAAHGGRIWATPRAEGGTIVRFELPRTPAAA